MVSQTACAGVFSMKKLQLVSVFLVCSLAGAYVSAQGSQQSTTNAPAAQSEGQAPPAGERARAKEGGGQGLRELFQNAISGSIQSVTADGVTIKKMDGTLTTVKTTKDTMFFRERQQAKLTDFKVGDMVIVAGDPAGENAVTAKVMAMRPNGPNAMNPEDLGKKFIVGEVTKIDETKLTIKRPDGVEQVIEVDDDTSFRNPKRESVTLADVKVGDRVMGRGELKNGTFVPATLMVGLPQQGQGFMMRRREGAESGNNPPASPEKSDAKPDSTPK